MKPLTIRRRLALGFGFVIALGLAVAVNAIYNLYALQQQFGAYEAQMVARERLALRGQAMLGNGIHYFKNTVLRGGDYPAKFAQSMDALERIADEYRALGPVGAEAGFVVLADGINSRFRDKYIDHFQPEVDLRSNKFAWMGSTRPLDAFTFIFEENEHGLFQVHAYPFEEGRSTWIVECREETWKKAGLEGFGKEGDYVARQVHRWTKQYQMSETTKIPEMDKLIDWLPKNVPPGERTSIVHGDYRIDNMIFAPEEAKVLAVLDWELSTLGDPLSDFTYVAMAWVTDNGGRSGVQDLDRKALGIPELDEVVERYCAATGRDGVPDMNWYFAYNFFRLAGIMQGIKKRVIDGLNLTISALRSTVA